MSVPSHEYFIYTPGEGFFESMGWNGITYSKSVDAAFCFNSKRVALDALESLPTGSHVLDAKSLPERMIEQNGLPLIWNRDARDLDELSDRELLEELCRRVVDYHASSLKFHDCERGTPDDVLDNDNNYCRVREVVKQVMGIDLEYVEEVRENNLSR